MSTQTSHRYKLTISLNVLNHLGLNLYSNTPAVLAEAISNAWDADATEVKIDIKEEEEVITITDNGSGMNFEDINNKFLLVGYQKRKELTRTPKHNREPMGRKGIGKLSLFSIAKKIFVYSKKDGQTQAFCLDVAEIERQVKSKGEASEAGDYYPRKEEFPGDLINGPNGTVIQIEGFKKKVTRATLNGLRRRVARRFSVIQAESNFRVVFNGSEVTYADRDYFDKARFLFQYGAHDYSGYCANLDKKENGEKAVYSRECRFNENGQVSPKGKYAIKGWIGVAKHSNDLDQAQDDDNASDDNLNNIAILVRGKLAQEDILHDFRLGGMITKYMYGEINADFLDDDAEGDIATSSRQKIIEDDVRYIALKKFINNELRYIWKRTNKLKERKGRESALNASDEIREWYESLEDQALKDSADKIFGAIEKLPVDGREKKQLFANGVLAFEKLRMKHALRELKKVDEGNIEQIVNIFGQIDEIEAAHYHEMIQERLEVIEKLEAKVDNNVLEKVLQEYIFNHLWLLDPGWERATEREEMEKTIKPIRDKDAEGSDVRVDIKYRRLMAGTNVIIELKRASVKLDKTDIEKQLKKYIQAVESQLNKERVRSRYVEGICLVGKLPKGWENSETREREERSLRLMNIRVVLYQELIRNARVAYERYLEVNEKISRFKKIMDSIGDIAKGQ